MKIEDIEIHVGGIDQAYKELGFIKAQVGAATAFAKTPTIEDVNFKLREDAAKKGANAIINVRYDRGVSWTSWKALTATGTAVLVEPREKKCPFCAEQVKAEAVVCKHCGKDIPRVLPSVDILASIPVPANEDNSMVVKMCPACRMSNNNLAISCSRCGAGLAV